MENRTIRKAAPGEFAFDISGGALCLDFVNTVDARATERRRERLESYTDLVAWGRQAGALTSGEAAQLVRAAARRQAAARAMLRSARTVRESLFRVFQASVEGRAPSAEDLVAFNTAAGTAFAHLGVRPAGSRFAWDWGEDAAGELGRVLWPVLRSAGELLTAPELERVRECAAPTCSWLFLDRSKNGSRRWCNMKVCGNRAKAQRFYRRSLA